MAAREEALEAFKERHWAMGIVLAEKTDMSDAELQFYMGLCLETGNGVVKDYAKAFEWYSKSAEQGNAKAMCNLGKMYEDGIGVDQNYDKAKEWYKKAAIAGDIKAKARLHQIGMSVDDKEMLVRRAKEAFENDEWTKGVLMAKQTDMSDAGLQMWVGYCYDEGKGVEKSVVKAFKWYKKAAENGNIWSMNQLGLKYERGEGTNKNLEEAVRWYKAAAEKGNKAAQYNLGDMYEYGKGTEKDLEEAVEWYRKAVEQGDEKAQKALERVEAAIAGGDDEDPIMALKRMIGLQSVKDQVKELVDLVKVQKMREAQGLPKVEMSYHCIFTGNPGTGKTTVARLYGKILHKLGIIDAENFVEADRSTLVGSYIGATEEKVNEAVNAAMDGVLFIDEAYALYNESEIDFGREAVDVLLKKMEDNRDRLVVILAGYEGKMERLFEMNEGMRSRFAHTIRFPDYSADELVEIFKKYALKNHCRPDEEALEAVREEAEFELAKRMEGFGNARYVRTLFERAVRKQCARIAAIGSNPGREELQRIVADDIPADSGRNGKEETLEDIFRELDGLVGLVSVKEEIRRLALFVHNQKQRKEAGLPVDVDASYHCVFTGNPGTGKTTVARYMARVYRTLGITRTSHLEEADRSMLIGEYVGQTAPKTNKKIDAALNGVLFIDEAYSLAGKYENDFGNEAIATLLKRMEDDRDRLVVIVAGYTKEMKDFIASNPGLKSRFTRYIEFPDYSADELAEVFARLAKKKGYELSAAASEAVADYTNSLIAHKDSHFGNAREMRNLFNEALEWQSGRLQSIKNPTKEQLMEILPEDIPNVVSKDEDVRESARNGMVQNGIAVQIEYSRHLNLALAQNSRPIVSAIRICNRTGRMLGDCSCRISCPEGYLVEYKWPIGDIADGGEVDGGSVPMRINVAALQKVESVKTAYVRVEVLSGGGVLFCHEYRIDAVTPSHAYDIVHNPEMLVAFVMPHCDEIRRLQSDTAKCLEQNTGDAALCGYQVDRKRVARICEAMFDALRSRSIRYAEHPAHYGLAGQKIRLPREIMEYKLATCMDTTLLFASLSEACGLNPVIVLVRGHALVGVMLEDRHLSQVAVDKFDEISRFCQDGMMIMIETTSVCSDATLVKAVKEGFQRLKELGEGDFQWAIDVRLARESGIRQLSLEDVPQTPSGIQPAPPHVLAPVHPSASPDGELSEAYLSAIKSPNVLMIDGARVAGVRRWLDVFQKLYEKLNEMDATQFDGLPENPQFGRYFMRLGPGQKTPRDYFKIKLGTDSNVRAKELANKAYLWRTDYYFRRLLAYLGFEASRIAVV